MIDFNDENLLNKAVENHLVAFGACKPMISKVLNITPERCDELLDDMRKELSEYETSTRTTRVYGRKKIESSI